MGVGKHFISSFSGNMQRELGGNSVHKGQAENSGFIMLDEPHEIPDMIVYDIHK